MSDSATLVGSKAALPIFKKFVESAIYKEEMKQFNVTKNI